MVRLPVPLAAEHEAQAVAPDLHLVAVLQARLVDALAVHVGAVQRTDVAQHVPSSVALDDDVTARHRDVVEEDLGIGMAPDGGHRRLEPVRGTGVRAVPHDEHADARREAVEVALQLVFGARPLRRPTASGSSPRRRRPAARRRTSRTGRPRGSDVHTGRKARGEAIRCRRNATNAPRPQPEGESRGLAF